MVLTGSCPLVSFRVSSLRYDISREDADEYALRSQHLWGEAHEAGVFADELAPIELKKGVLDKDEHARPGTDAAGLAKLPSVFKKGGTVTAGNASGICDGAAALVLASEAAVSKHNLKPLAQLTSWGV